MKKLALATLLLAGGCLDFDSLPGLFHGDLGTRDLASSHADAVMANDLAMSIPPDLAMARDGGMPHDQSIPIDQNGPIDQAAPVDKSVPIDQIMIADQAHPPDQFFGKDSGIPVPDLACGAVEGDPCCGASCAPGYTCCMVQSCAGPQGSVNGGHCYKP